MTLECDAKFEEKLTFGLENKIKNLANFDQSTRASKIFELKIYRRVMYHENEE